MCGIAGMLVQPGKRDKKTQDLLKSTMRFLLLGIQPRGLEATGACWVAGTGDFQLLKADIRASAFLKSSHYASWEKAIPEDDSLAIIAHTRFPTVGSTKTSANNHPIKCGPVVGVHNGHVSNHTQVRTKMSLKKDGDVDSEVIFRVLEKHIDSSTKELNTSEFTRDFKELCGQAAVAAINMHKPGKLFLARSGNPISIAEHESLGVYAFSSFLQDLRSLSRTVIKGWRTFDMKEDKWILVNSKGKFTETFGDCKMGTYGYARNFHQLGYYDTQQQQWITPGDSGYNAALAATYYGKFNNPTRGGHYFGED